MSLESRCSSDRSAGKARFRAIVGLLLAVALSVGVGGCSKDPQPYDFNGTWVAAYQVVESNVRYIPLGLASTGTAVIDQNEGNIVVTLGTGFPMNGSCDALAKTFSVTDQVGATQRIFSGAAEDEETLFGTLALSKNQERVILSWTMNLVSRTKGTAGDGTGGCAIEASLACAISGR